MRRAQIFLPVSPLYVAVSSSLYRRCARSRYSDEMINVPESVAAEVDLIREKCKRGGR